MFYILFPQGSNDSEVFYYGTPINIDYDTYSQFSNGQRIEQSIPNIELIFDEDSQGELIDCIPGSSGLLISMRFNKVLESCGLDNIQYFPCSIRNSVTKEMISNYFIANIIGVVFCVDFEKSDLEMVPHMFNKIEFFNSLTLDETKIPKNLKIFRLGEFTNIIVTEQNIKMLVKKTISLVLNFTNLKTLIYNNP
jgi:hypothetical protein